MSMGLLLAILGGLIALLGLWAFWLAPRLGPRLDHAQKSAMIAFQMVTALAILSAGILYLDEQQWSPRLGVELKADPKLVPESNPESAVVQLSIGITNMTETNQTVNFIDVAAYGNPGRRQAGVAAFGKPRGHAALSLRHLAAERRRPRRDLLQVRRDPGPVRMEPRQDCCEGAETARRAARQAALRI